MAEEKKDEKKIIVDEDWKQQAKKEKEVLAQQEKTEDTSAEARRGPLPKGDFAALVSMLVTQAFFAMGLLKVEGQEKEPDLEMAKYNIDMLETLGEKTKDNLTEEEQKVLTETLNQLRMAYVKVAG
ncbi:MAG: DUF1844 domain-containing protein [Planctomycetota bacterium]|jgi:hypothetical protein